MTDLLKGHIKLYFRNDGELYERVRRHYENDYKMTNILEVGFRKKGEGRTKHPYYIRIFKGEYAGKNTSGDFFGSDTDETVMIEAETLLFTELPDEMFVI